VKIDKNILNNLKFGIAIFDSNKSLVFENHSFLEILGASATELLHNEVKASEAAFYKPDAITLIDVESMPVYKTINGKEKCTEEYFISFPFAKVKAKRIILNTNIVNDSSGELDYIIVTIQTKSNEVRYDLNTQVYITKLENAENELKQAYEKVRLKNLYISDFTTHLAHDLKSPLSAVIGFIDCLSENSAELEEAERYRILELAFKSCLKMNDFIDEVLNFATVSITEDESEEIDLNDLIDEIHSLVAGSLYEGKGQLNHDILPIIKCMSLSTKIMLQNIIMNAIKYADKKRSLKINIKMEQGAHETDLIIEDNGIGFDNSVAKKIFEPLERLGHSQQEGFGFGLAVVQKITEQHDWKVRAEGVPGEGAKFIISIPNSDIISIKKEAA
jgi:signal transduction histidine kinase